MKGVPRTWISYPGVLGDGEGRKRAQWARVPLILEVRVGKTRRWRVWGMLCGRGREGDLEDEEEVLHG